MELSDKELSWLTQAVAESPFSGDARATLLDRLRSAQKWDLLGEAREDYVAKMPMPAKLWYDWITDASANSSSHDDDVAVLDLGNRALTQHPVHPGLWKQVFSFLHARFAVHNGSTHFTTEVVRHWHQRCIHSIGCDPSNGPDLWDIILEWEECMSDVLSSIAKESTEQEGRIRSLWRQRLALPLFRMEVALEDYQAWEAGQIMPQSESVMAAYQKAHAQLSFMAPWEEKVSHLSKALDSYEGDADDSDVDDGDDSSEEANVDYDALLRHCKAYIVWASHAEQAWCSHAITCLYERVLATFSSVEDVWWSYHSHVLTHDRPAVLSVLQRAVAHVYWSGDMWIELMSEMEFAHGSSCDDTQASTVHEVAQRALSAGLASAEAYANVLRQWVDHEHRRASATPSNQLDAMKVEQSMLAQHMAPRVDLLCAALAYEARWHHNVAKDSEAAIGTWERCAALAAGSASMWIEYAGAAQEWGLDAAAVRCVWTRAMEAVQDWPQSVATSWLAWEREHGDLQAWRACWNRTRKLHAAAAAAATSSKAGGKRNPRQQRQKKSQQSGGGGRASAGKKGGKRNKGGDGGAKKKRSRKEAEAEAPFWVEVEVGADAEPAQSGEDGVDGVHGEGIDGDTGDSGPSAHKRLRRTTATEGTEGTAEHKQGEGIGDAMVTGGDDEAAASATDADTAKDADADSDTATEKQARTIHVSNIPFALSQDQVEQLCAEHGGPVAQVRMGRDKFGASRGFAFVEFYDAESAAKAITALRDHAVSDAKGERKLRVASSQDTANEAPPQLDVYVGNISWGASETDIRKCIASVEGVSEEDVVSLRLVTGHDGRFKGGAFARMRTEEAVAALIGVSGKVSILGRPVRMEEPLRNKTRSSAPSGGGSLGPLASDECTIFVSEVPGPATDGDIRNAFATCGKVAAVRFRRHRDTGECFRGRGYVDFDSPVAKQAALASGAGPFLVLGQPVKVEAPRPAGSGHTRPTTRLDTSMTVTSMVPRSLLRGRGRAAKAAAPKGDAGDAAKRDNSFFRNLINKPKQ